MPIRNERRWGTRLKDFVPQDLTNGRLACERIQLAASPQIRSKSTKNRENYNDDHLDKHSGSISCVNQ